MKLINSPRCQTPSKQAHYLPPLPLICTLVSFLAAMAAAPTQAEQSATALANDPAPAVQVLQDVEANHFDHSDVLIVSVGSSVYSDFDNDGFFTNFTLTFDADVRYGDEWVYANIFLRGGGSDYLFFHSSDAFEIYESSIFDEYRLDSELVSNYPAAYYDVRIELRDAYSDRLLDVVDASTHRTLFALPLESRDSSDSFGNSVDTQILAPLNIDGPELNLARDQIVHEQVGASYALLPLLGLGLLARQRRRQLSNKPANGL